jgi:tRNA(Phe) wybutosine-synthesizing methylase Tyw3
MTPLAEAEYLEEAAHQYQETLLMSHSACLHLVGSMRRNYANGMTIVELARISGFSRPTVMKYVQNVTTAP